MTTALQIIEAGYSRSTANDPGKLATDDELLGRLDRSYQGLFALAARQRPDEFATQASIVLVAPDSRYDLTPGTIEVRRLRSASLRTVHLIPAAEIDRLWHVAPCMYRTGNSLYSRGKAGDPVTGDTLTAWLLLPGTSLTTLATVLDATFPTRHVEILVNDLALYLDAKDEDRDPAQFQKLAGDQAMKLAAFAGEYDLDASALEFVHAPSTRVPAKGSGA